LAIFVAFSRLAASFQDQIEVLIFVSEAEKRLQRTYSNCRSSLFSQKSQ